jgi:hypothetical protein
VDLEGREDCSSCDGTYKRGIISYRLAFAKAPIAEHQLTANTEGDIVVLEDQYVKAMDR